METTNTWFTQKAIEFNEKRFASMTWMITVQSCLGSIAVMYILMQPNILLLSICAIITMASNAAFISQAPAKWCLSLFYSSIIINSLLLIFGLSTQ